MAANLAVSFSSMELLYVILVAEAASVWPDGNVEALFPKVSCSIGGTSIGVAVHVCSGSLICGSSMGDARGVVSKFWGLGISTGVGGRNSSLLCSVNVEEDDDDDEHVWESCITLAAFLSQLSSWADENCLLHCVDLEVVDDNRATTMGILWLLIHLAWGKTIL